MKSYPQKLGLASIGNLFSLVGTHRKQVIVFLFFVLCFVGVLLGDGKQAVVDVFVSGGVVCLYGFFLFGKISPSPLPLSLYWSWIILLGYLGVHTVISDSVGASIYTTMRMVGAFLVFLLFVSLSSKKTTLVFSKGLAIFFGVVCGLSFYFWFFSPTIGDGLLMHLAYANYGHSHFSILLLLLLPTFFYHITTKGPRRQMVYMLLFGVILLITFSRAALLVGALYFLIIGIQYRKKSLGLAKKSALLVALFLGVFVFLSLSRQILGTAIVSQTPLLLQKYIFKPTMQEEGRFEYWRQALVAIYERPLFGSGPGTFDLLSRRLQNHTRQFSWFTHNALLQVLAEVGFVGSIFFVVLGIMLVRQIEKPLSSPLFVGVCLVGILGLVDFVWDFYIVQILLAAILGLLVGENKQTHTRKKESIVVFIFLVIFLAFYVSGFGSLMAQYVFKNQKLAFLMAPYNKKLALTNGNSPQNQITNFPYAYSLLEYFFHGDSDVLSSLVNSDTSEKNAILARIFYLDPYRLDLGKKYILSLDQEKKYQELSRALSIYILNKYTVVAKYIDVHTMTLVLSLPENREHVHVFLEPVSSLELSKAFYFTGLSYLPIDKVVTRQFWHLALHFSPEWSYFYLELARIQNDTHQPQEAMQTLNACLKNRYAEENCRYFWELPFAMGAFRQEIFAARP